MKFHCDRDKLMRELSLAQEVVSNRVTISILSNVYLHAEDGTLTIRATDTKTAFETRIPVVTENPGSITVNSDKFLSSLKNLPDGEVLFEVKPDGMFVIRPEKRVIDYQLRTMGSESYPWGQWETEGVRFSLPRKDFLDMVNQTIFAVSTDESRYFMTGVLFDYKDHVLRFVATDGRRMSVARLESGLPENFSVIVPTKPLNMIRKIASEHGMMDILITSKTVVFHLDNQKIYTNVIDGQFPNYQRVIPESQTYTAKFNRLEFLEAVRRVSIMADSKSQRILISLERGKAAISSEMSELGTAREEIGIDYDGDPTLIAMNYQYLLDPLRVCDEDEIYFQFTDPKRAVTLKPSPERSYFHIIMPMQITD